MPVTSRARATRSEAFTLVELLVVIGVIALVIGLLMPSLSAARRVALRTQCAARLNQQLLAAQIHALDHHGYYPLIGVLPGLTPPEFNDTYLQKYDYFSYPFAGYQRMMAPITISLASEMSYRYILDVKSNNAVGVAEQESPGFIKHFLCPSQTLYVAELQQLPMLYMTTDGVYYTESLGFIYNEAVLGWGDRDIYNRAKGKAGSIRQSSKTMFVSDGVGGAIYNARFPYATGKPMATVYNIAINPPVTLADAYTGNGKAGDPQNFDRRRHNGKMNIGFCDGHVESRSITANDLSGVFLLAP